MKKPAVLLFTAVVFLSLLFIPSASAGSVSVSFSGETDVLSGQTYTYNYIISMKEIQSVKLCFKCDDAHISGDTKVYFEETMPYKNVDLVQNGSLNIVIQESANIGDSIVINVSGKYTTVNESGIPDSFGDIIESYTLKVVSDEEPTPVPTPVPTQEPAPSVYEDPTPTPSQEPTPTAAPKNPPRTSEKPINTSSPAKVSESPLPAPSQALQVSKTPSPTVFPDTSDSLRTEMDMITTGGSITISMEPSDSTLSSLMLNSLKAKQSVLIVNFSGYSCQIDGNKLGDSLTEPVNLAMSMADAAAVSDVANGQDIYQLHFAETGDFPGCIIYSFKALDSQSGDILYLYQYHAASGLTEYKQCVTVDDQGCASFDIYEGGSYFVTTSQYTANPMTGEKTITIDTSANNPLIVFITVICVICAVAAAFAVFLSMKFLKKHNHENHN